MKRISSLANRLFVFFCIFASSSAYKPDLYQDVKECTPDCPSQIYCSGELLHDVQVSRLFGQGNGTTFVEKKLLYPESQIVEKYKQLKKKNSGRTPSVQQLRKFVNENFADDLLRPCNFSDFKPNPSILKRTNIEKYKKWLRSLNELWKQLGGEISDDVKKNPERHSYLYVPNKFIRAGGRFTGTYYWDSYWIVKGLLLSDMVDTARGIIENVIYLVNKIGHMPNGNRIFYMTRSQPPMLITMVALFYEFTGNRTFLEKNIEFLEKEFLWWHTNREIKVAKNGRYYSMYRYKSVSCVPRPESYAEDYELVENIKSDTEKVRIFTGIRSAAETGWDFSSRHVRDPSTPNNKTLLRMEPQNMVYVDLNSIMHSNAKYLAGWYTQLGDKSRSRYYGTLADNLLEAIETILWNGQEGTWLDYDLILEKQRNAFYISNLTPLWSRSFLSPSYVEKSIQYLVRQGIVGPSPTYKPTYYCVPTSVDNSTQQWDYPNCWAPLQAFLVQGLLRNTDATPEAEKVAFSLGQQWIKTTYEGFRRNQVMYEKPKMDPLPQKNEKQIDSIGCLLVMPKGPLYFVRECINALVNAPSCVALNTFMQANHAFYILCFTDRPMMGIKYSGKYSATTFGSTGGGGEYNAQTGFGWTNGYCMELFSVWGTKLT